MGTSYTIYEDDTTEVCLSEMSNKLELIIFKEDTSLSTKMLQPEDILKMLMKGIRDVSYWISEEDFNEIFSKLEVYPY